MTEQQQQDTGDQQGQQQAASPPWGDDANFDPQKAWNLIQGLKADKEKLSARPVLDDEAQRRLGEYDRLVEASKTDLERKTEELTRWQTDAARWRDAAVASTVKALAATEFADPDDAVRSLDPAKYLDAGGTIDEQAIRTDLAGLLEAKPHYRRQAEPTGPRLPAPNSAQGSGSGRPVSDPAQQFAAILQGRMS